MAPITTQHGTITKRYLVWADFTSDELGDFDVQDNDEIFIKTRDGEFTMTFKEFRSLSRSVQ